MSPFTTSSNVIVLIQKLLHAPFVEKHLFRLEQSGCQDPHLLAIRPVDTENPVPTRRTPEIEKSGAFVKTRRIREQTNCEWVFKRLFDGLKPQVLGVGYRGIVPVKVHSTRHLGCKSNMHAK
ncbi:MAG: hypothetical protein ISQ14_04610 [Verrucomicrobiae bacterium]|nr:hypothetical protein [Verrucomicrobiae bacterium]